MIHGGEFNGRCFNDFHALNLQTMQWTKIEETGLLEGISRHSLTKVSEKDIVLVGGDLETIESNKLMIYNVKKGQWREKAPLPVEVAGLLLHGAIHVPNEDGVFILCVGGFVNRQLKNHPNAMALLNIQYTQ